VAGTQPRDISHERRSVGRNRQPTAIGTQVRHCEIAFESLAKFPRQIVMPVDQRRSRENSFEPQLIRGGASGGCNGQPQQ